MELSDREESVEPAAPIVTGAQPAAEFRPYYEVKSNHTVWYDFAVMKLPHLFESLGKMGLVRRFDATLRLCVHTATVNVTAGSPALRDLNYPQNKSFSNTCPLDTPPGELCSTFKLTKEVSTGKLRRT